MRSERTKECIRKRWQYQFLSWFLCFGLAVALIIYGFSTKWIGVDTEVVYHIKALLTIAVLSLLPMITLSFLVKDKIKPTIRMLNIILAAYLVANWFMYIVGVLMLIDTYLISGLIERNKAAAITNKEIDLRGEYYEQSNILRE